MSPVNVDIIVPGQVDMSFILTANRVRHSALPHRTFMTK